MRAAVIPAAVAKHASGDVMPSAINSTIILPDNAGAPAIGIDHDGLSNCDLSHWIPVFDRQRASCPLFLKRKSAHQSKNELIFLLKFVVMCTT
jgi:hypothetical protein